MKRYLSIPIALIICALALSSCEDRSFQTTTANVPIYLSFDDLRKAIVVEEPRDILQPGKIYFKDNYIFINEFMEGVHIIDISDPSSPDHVAYLPVPGAIDMAIKDDILYIDSYTDLVMIDISDPENPVEERRINDILEYTLPPYDINYPLADVDKEEGVVTDWEIKKYTREIHSNPYPIYRGWEKYDMLSSSMPMGGGGASGSVYGVGGSMARFLTYDNYLYMLQSDYMLKIVAISSPDNPAVVYEKYVGWGLETMFIYEDYMYLGATDGLYIMDLRDPKSPYIVSVYRHITSCDPVVVSGDLAYITLRSGNICGASADLLEVIDISDKSDPTKIASYGMTEPYGLGISGSTLFVCEGENGLKVFNITDPYSITSNKLAEFSDIQATDVIPINNTLYTIGDGGFYIYDYTDITDITQVGSILISTD
ncbi:MAG: hypothetical protein PF450_05580 [Bacteroidales bacterium]|jgi:hypothetical protein|nr:hypothetical protein [Bacteroidales bacterium]